MVLVLILMIVVCAFIGWAHPELVKLLLAIVVVGLAVSGVLAVLRDIAIRL